MLTNNKYICDNAKDNSKYDICRVNVSIRD